MPLNAITRDVYESERDNAMVKLKFNGTTQKGMGEGWG